MLLPYNGNSNNYITKVRLHSAGTTKHNNFRSFVSVIAVAIGIVAIKTHYFRFKKEQKRIKQVDNTISQDKTLINN